MTHAIDTDSSLIVGPTREPIDLDETKRVLKFTSTLEDTLLDVWIAAARQHFEEMTGRQLMTATWELWLDSFPDGSVIELPHPPLQEVLSITYDETVLDEDTYVVIAPQGPTCGRGRVGLISGQRWPMVATQPGAVRIRYRAGYGETPADVPELIRGALYALVGLSFRYRTEGTEKAVNTVPLGAETVLRAFTLSAGPVLARPSHEVIR